MTIAHVFAASEVPANITVGDTGGITVGLQFVAALGGTVTGARYYRSQTTAGQQTAAIWNSAGTLLASKPFSGETASGWQEQSFDTPVPVTALAAYTVGVFMAIGGYAVTSNYFTTGRQHPKGLVSTPPGVAAGVFSSGGSLTLPTTVYGNNNYWVDVAYATDVVPATLFADTVAPVNTDLDRQIPKGVRFTVARNGKCYGVRQYRPSVLINDGGVLYASDGTILASALFPTAALNKAPDWQCYLFATPVSVAPGQVYTAAGWNHDNADYSFDLAAFGAPLVSGPLTALATSNGGNGVFNGGPVSDPTVPGNAPVTDGGANYWVDPLFVADDVVPGTGAPVVVFLA